MTTTGTLSPCKIIRGKAFNITQNTQQPLAVLRANVTAVNDLINDWEVFERCCFVGSSCMYPMRDGALREEMLGTGEVYEGNALYAYTKLLGWQICKAISAKFKSQYFVAIPSDIFGEPDNNHFIGDMFRKFHLAKEEKRDKVEFFGTGTPIRHPIFHEDFERILKDVCDIYSDISAINIATPPSWAKSVCSIARDVQSVVGFGGAIEWDASYPDGQKVKILDNEKLTRLLDPKFTPWMESLEKTYSEIKNHL